MGERERERERREERRDREREREPSVYSSMIPIVACLDTAGLGAGLLATTTTYPFDVLRTTWTLKPSSANAQSLPEPEQIVTMQSSLVAISPVRFGSFSVRALSGSSGSGFSARTVFKIMWQKCFLRTSTRS